MDKRDELIAKQAQVDCLKTMITAFNFCSDNSSSCLGYKYLIQTQKEIESEILTSEIEAGKDETIGKCYGPDCEGYRLVNSDTCGKPTEKPEPVSAETRTILEDLMLPVWLGGMDSQLERGISFEQSLLKDGSSDKPSRMTVKDVIDTLEKMLEEYATLRAAQGKGKEVKCDNCGRILKPMYLCTHCMEEEMIKEETKTNSFESQTPVQSVSDEDVNNCIHPDKYQFIDVDGHLKCALCQDIIEFKSVETNKEK